MDILGLVIGALAIVIAVFIAWQQHGQLLTLTKISRETGDTARKLKTETFIREVVDSFFFLRRELQQSLKCE